MKIVVDSSVLIDHLRGGKIGNQLFDRIEKQNAALFIPTVVIYELYSGKSSKEPQLRTKIVNLISTFRRVELTEKIAIRAGELYRDLGIHIGVQDYIIAASALSIDAAVLTLNTKHFEQIPNLRLYPL